MSLLNTSAKLFTSEFEYYNAQLITNKAKNFSKESRHGIIIKKGQNQYKDLDQKIVDKLTNREKEICHHIINGYTYQKTAEELVISVNTIKKHIKKYLPKNWSKK